MAGQHVREQTHRMRDRPQEERKHLDEHHQRQNENRMPDRNEQFEELQAVLVEAVDQHRQEHEHRERGRDDDVAGES